MQRVSGNELLVLSHSQQPIEIDRVFCNVPREIGKLQSAFSTLRPGKIPWLSWLGALLMACVGGALGGVFAYMIVYFDGPTWLYPFFAVPFGGGTFYIVAPAARITYVGEKGIFVWQRKFGKETEQRVLFGDDIRLFVRLTRSFHNGIYTGTEYAFAFVLPDPKDKLMIDGRYYSQR